MENIKKKSFDYSLKIFELAGFIQINSFAYLNAISLGDLQNV